MDIKQEHVHPLHEGLEHSFEDSLSIGAMELSNFEKLSFWISRRLFGINNGTLRKKESKKRISSTLNVKNPSKLNPFLLHRYLQLKVLHHY